MSRVIAHAVVSLAALDVRRTPSHRAELGSQLLLGEGVRIAARRDGGRWVQVEGEDGYGGWARAWGLVEAPAARVAGWRRRATARVSAALAEVHTEPHGRGALVSPLFLNARLIAGRARSGHVPVELPDGRRGFVPAAALAAPRTPPPPLIDRVRSLLGVPYLWGGRTPAGFDCSGFTQQVLAEQGVAIPRDARHQYRSARRLGRDETPCEGDLIFFASPGEAVGHVGLGLGGLWFAHCRGRVRVNSADPANQLCDNELQPTIRGWRRPHAAPARAGSKRQSGT